MPAYEFQCRRCERLFEARMTMAEYGAGKHPACPDCGDPSPSKVLSSNVNILTGWPGTNPAKDVPGVGGCGTGSCGCH